MQIYCINLHATYAMYNEFMKGSILVYGGLREDRVKKIEDIILQTETKIHDNPDVLFIERLEDKNSIGIDQTRGLIKYITQKPFSSRYKYVIIKEAHLLTPEAQNALLKILEEPPTYATIILEAKNLKSLLPTVISRCQRVEVKFKEISQQPGENTPIAIDEIKKMTLGERLAWAADASKEEKDEVINMLESWIIQERELLAEISGATENIDAILEIKNDFENTNVNLKLGLEYLMTLIK